MSEEELRWERRARKLLQETSLAGMRATTVVEAFQAALDAVCAATGWPVGHVYRLGNDGKLASARLWHLDHPALHEPFRQASEGTRFEKGVGLPGRVAASGRPAWIMDVAQDENFPRRFILDLDLHAAFGFPVIAGGSVEAVLEFFSPVTAEPDLPLLDVMEAVGAQLGRALERARAESALRDSEARFRSVAETASDAIISADGRGLIVGWNRAATNLFGWAEAEAMGRPLTLIIPPDLRDAHEGGIARVLSGGDRHVIGRRTAELRALRKDGSQLAVELSLAHWRLGDADYFTGILRDISDRKSVQRVIQATTERLAASERRAVQANRAKSAFLANMSHELRTPLNAILGFAELMTRDRSLGTEPRENVAVILRSAEHLLGLINDVLSIARIEAGELRMHAADFDLRALIEGLGAMFRPRAETRGIAFALEAAPELPRFAHGDEGKLRQVLLNLVGNAVKFTTEGGVAVRAGWEAGRATFEVEDTGPGMTDEEVTRLFEPFTQAEAGLRSNEGTGLGLAISHHLVRILGGTLAVRSTLGRGTRFSFTVELPAVEGMTTKIARRVIGLAPGQRARRVLVVDDSADNRRWMSRLLASVGFEVNEAADGEQGVKTWEAWGPDLVWMDMRMPRVDGYQATSRIRERERAEGRPRTPIIALTASAFEHDQPAILAAGCDAVVAKPCREATIFGVLAERLGVQFVHDEARAAAPTALSPDRLRAFPRETLERLRAALACGDDLAAARAVDDAARHDGPLAAAVAERLARFEFDELLSLVEGALA